MAFRLLAQSKRPFNDSIIFEQNSRLNTFCACCFWVNDPLKTKQTQKMECEGNIFHGNRKCSLKVEGEMWNKKKPGFIDFITTWKIHKAITKIYIRHSLSKFQFSKLPLKESWISFLLGSLKLVKSISWYSISAKRFFLFLYLLKKRVVP